MWTFVYITQGLYFYEVVPFYRLPSWFCGTEFVCQWRLELSPWVRKIPWSTKRQPTAVFLPGKSRGQESMMGYGPWGRSESDRAERLHFHFSPSCIGEGNGNPLQYSCLENPRDRGDWWAAVYGVTQSRTRLKRLSSSSKWVIIFHGAVSFST